jgi:hypothetical protein
MLDTNNYAVTEKESDAYAKEIITNGKAQYYILSQNNSIFNPFSIYGPSRSKRLFADKDKKFIKVSKYIFDKYVQFLNSQNLSLLYNVQREALI